MRGIELIDAERSGDGGDDLHLDLRDERVAEIVRRTLRLRYMHAVPGASGCQRDCDRSPGRLAGPLFR